MRWPARFRDDERGFTLVELIIGIAITGLLISAISSALFVALRTTDLTNKRMAESHDVQIVSAYLANDVQSASGVNAPNATTDCTGVFTTLITFTYSTSGNPTAVYKCGTVNGETQVTRTFNNGTPNVIAHFAGATANVTVTYDPAQPAVPVSATITLRKASDCTLDCTYTLFGSRRSFAPSPAAGTGGPPTGNVVLLSTGASSPLWVQGKCVDPGTTLGSTCTALDPTITALPKNPDVLTVGWSVTPLYDKLMDQDPATYVTSPLGNTSEARVTMSSVNPPDPNSTFTPIFEFHASKVTGSAPKAILSIYDGSTTPPTLLTSTPSNKAVGPINQTTPGAYDWQLTPSQMSSIPTSAYAHLVLGFKLSSPSATDQIRVDGVAFDTASPSGLLTIMGPLYVNSQISSAVRLTGVKSGADATKISIVNGGDFRIWSPGACSGCDHNTVACTACSWVGQQPWTNYTNPIPDPLQALPAPAVPPTTACTGTSCPPGRYLATLTGTNSQNIQLSPGVYYLEQGLSFTGSSSLTCPACTGGEGVLLYIAAGSVTFAGSSSVNLTASNSGTYQGILMFQARSDQNELKFAGNSGSGTTNVLGGVVYVPRSIQVTLATGSASLTAKAIVAQNIKVSSSVTIG
jgi:prepilin-type N-terminal cleavage/methylation domain-containing protein